MGESNKRIIEIIQEYPINPHSITKLDKKIKAATIKNLKYGNRIKRKGGGEQENIKKGKSICEKDNKD